MRKGKRGPPFGNTAVKRLDVKTVAQKGRRPVPVERGNISREERREGRIPVETRNHWKDASVGETRNRFQRRWDTEGKAMRPGASRSGRERERGLNGSGKGEERLKYCGWSRMGRAAKREGSEELSRKTQKSTESGDRRQGEGRGRTTKRETI